MNSRISILPGLLVALLLAPANAQSTVPDDLCTGDPCVISTDVTIDPDTVLDFGGRSLVIAENVVVRVGANGTLCGPCDVDADCGTGTCVGAIPPSEGDPGERGLCATIPRSLRLIANDITLYPGARLLGDPNGSRDNVDGDRAEITVEALAGDVTLQTDARIDVRADCDWAGNITILAPGDAVLDGNLLASAQGFESTGGEIRVETSGSVVLRQEVNAEASGEFAVGGSLDVLAGHGITVDARLIASGGSYGAGTVTLLAGASAHVNATILANGGDPDGDGGDLEINAGEDILLAETALLVGTGGAGGIDCGDGMSVSLYAGRHLFVDGDIEVRGGFDCFGGDLLFDARLDFVQGATSQISTSTSGPDGGAGVIEILAGRGSTLQRIDGNAPGFASDIFVSSGHFIDVLGKTTVRGVGNPLSIGGRIELRSCTIDVAAPAGELDARSTLLVRGLGSNVIQARGLATVSGTLQAASPDESATQVGNFITYRNVAPSLTGAIDPAAILTADPSLPECGYCGDGIVQTSLGEVCDDGGIENCDGCEGLCQRLDAVCGDGVLECTEECDDGNTVPGDGCEPDCTLGPISTPGPTPTPTPTPVATTTPLPTPTPTVGPTPAPTPTGAVSPTPGATATPVQTRYVESGDLCGGREPCHAAAQVAATAVVDGDTIRLASEFFDESVTFDLPAGDLVRVEGGWNPSFTERNDRTLVLGSPGATAQTTLRGLTIRGGTLLLR